MDGFRGCRSWPAIGACFALLVSTGCAVEDDQLGGCGFQVCDIRQAACQRTTTDALACLRGGDTGMPAIDVVDPDEFAELTAGEPPSDEDRREAERFLRGLSLLGLARADATLEQETEDVLEEIAAAYLPEEERVLVIDRGDALESEDLVVLLAHELVHAMQDREHDLETLGEEISAYDRYLALKSLVEGEATHYEILAAAELQGAPRTRIDWQTIYARFQQLQIDEAMLDESPYLFASVRFPYAFGGELVTDAWLRDRAQGVRELFDAPPASTLEVLLRDRSEPAPVHDDEPSLDDARVPMLGDSFDLVGTDTLGVWLLMIARDRLGLAEGFLLDELVRAWVDDSVAVFVVPDNEQLVLALRIRFLRDTEADLIEQWRDQWQSELPDGSSISVEDQDLIVFLSDGPLVAEELAEVEWGPAPEPDSEEESSSSAARAHVRGRL